MNPIGRTDIWVSDIENGSTQRLTNDAKDNNDPVWAIYYWKMDQLIVAQVEPGGTDAPLVVGNRTPLFRAPDVKTDLGRYDASPDGKRFAVVTAEKSASRLLVLNGLDDEPR